MPNIGGPCGWKRKLLGTVVDSQLLYATPAWIGKATVAARTRANMIRQQRAVALRTIRAYRSVSDEATLVLASTVPADLLGLERKRIQSRLATETAPGALRPSKASVRREERARTIEAWQQRWEATSKASWTKRHCRDTDASRNTSPMCLQCLSHEDTAEHTLTECPNWSAFQVPLATQLGHSPTAADIGDIVCGPPFDQLPADEDEKRAILMQAEETFQLSYRMIEDILTVKEDEERARQAAEPADGPDVR
ncbi:uncharacterized protein LOC132932865 [Metopolophium dirhodum]|uniref:uncharacterized protein LOC132932865 n=1 Tax=Metopolophium dirhodum TaxID=44670 RepID=UPI0029904DF1|nr:uncharacterized protein LOC132932865 [Metopolophium dirhodum]